MNRSNRPINVAVGRDYDRTSILTSKANDELAIDGGEQRVTCTVLASIHDAFRALTSDGPYHAAEMSMAFYIALCDSETPPPFVALPIFISRSFRYGNLYVKEGSPLTCVSDLRGKKIGLPEYGMTMGVWIRGMLSDLHGISANEIEWVTTRDPVLSPIPSGVARRGIKVSHLDEMTVWDALTRGLVDVAIGRPSPDSQHAGPFRPLLNDYWTYDVAYFRSTGIFPIMHTIAVRRNLCEEASGYERLIFDAMCHAKSVAIEELRDCAGTLSVTLPSLPWVVESAIATFGANWWPYGIEANKKALETLLRYCHEQGVVESLQSVDELFCPHSKQLIDSSSVGP